MQSTARAADFIPQGAPWRYFKATQEPSPADLTAWRNVEFNDSGWLTGVTPLYYGEPLSGTELSDMRGLYTGVYLRYKFTVANPQDVQSLMLRVLSDDGFVAWLNGQDVRYNVPGGVLTFDDRANGALSEPIPFEDYPIANPGALLRVGENILAIHSLNSSLSDSSDFVINPILTYVQDELPPVVERVLPPSGAVIRRLFSVEIQFSEGVNGVEAADLLINGQPAAGLTEFGPGQFVFTFDEVLSGEVRIEFRSNHGITDRAGTSHPFQGGSWTFTVDPNAPAAGVLISEFMTDNDRTLRDDDGERSDWIELHNSGNTTISLAGWSLTDNRDNPGKWKFPAVSLTPNAFLIVYASGKNRTNSVAPLHTRFKLTSDAGGFLALYDAGSVLVSGFTNYPVQLDDVSYGRSAGAPNLVGYFTQPTPGTPNASQGPGFAPPVIFSVTSRTYQGQLNLSLGVTNSTATIRYTLDGTLPTENSPVYAGNLSFTGAARIRARSFISGLLPGPVRSETFIPLANPAATFSSDLPVMLIHNFGAGRPSGNSDTFAFVQVFEPKSNGVTSMTNAPTLVSRSIISARGSSTEGYPKVSLKLEFQDELGFDRDLALLGLPEDSDWILYAPNNFEPILFHNPFAHQLGRDIGRYSVRTKFVEVYLVQDGVGPVGAGSYNGIYVLEEKVKISDDRVSIASLNPQDNQLPAVGGGYLMKIDRPDPGDGGFYAANQSIKYVDPKEEEISLPERQAQQDYIQSYMDAFGSALYGANYRHPVNGYRAFVDVDSWVDHHLVNVLTFNVDALRLSAFFYKPRTGKLNFGPLWDFDRALNSTDGRDSNPRVWRSQSGDLGTDFFNYPWWDRMFTDPDFYQEYVDRYQELRRSNFSTTNLWRLTDELANEVRRAQPREQARWGITPRGGSYQAEVNLLKSWLSNRVTFMDSQFVRPPQFGRDGGLVSKGYQLTLNVPSGTTVYFTLDGTDPRALGSANGDAVATGAKVYTGPITIVGNARVVARARNTAHTALTGPNNPPLKSIWSGKIAATYVVDQYPVTVTEIMYHPGSDGPNSGFDSDDFEFIELKNRGTNLVNLVGFQLQGAVQFTFSSTNSIRELAPGGRLVLIKNGAAFGRRYQGVTNIAGEYSGQLSNGGERLELSGPLKVPVFDFRYSPAWQTNTDGTGFSLVLIDESIANEKLGESGSWTSSAEIGGSPGAAEPSTLILSAAPSAEGGFSIGFRGLPGAVYLIQYRENIETGDWITESTRTSPLNGVINHTAAVEGISRFYRVVRE